MSVQRFRRVLSMGMKDKSVELSVDSFASLKMRRLGIRGVLCTFKEFVSISPDKLPDKTAGAELPGIAKMAFQWRRGAF